MTAIDADWTASPYTFAVIAERGLLAITDPEGEADALVPLDQMTAARTVAGYANKHRPRPSRTSSSPSPRWDNDSILAALGVPAGRTVAVVACPAHADRHPSLAVRLAGDRLLLRCWAGCGWAAIIAAVQP